MLNLKAQLVFTHKFYQPNFLIFEVTNVEFKHFSPEWISGILEEHCRGLGENYTFLSLKTQSLLGGGYI